MPMRDKILLFWPTWRSYWLLTLLLLTGGISTYALWHIPVVVYIHADHDTDIQLPPLPAQNHGDDGSSPSAMVAAQETSSLLGALIPILGLGISLAGTAAMIVFQWRNERRQTRQFELIIRQMQLQIDEMERRATTSKLTEQEPTR